MIKYYNSLSSFSKTYLNNSKEKEVGKEPTQTNFTRRKSRFFSLIAFFLFMTGTFSFSQTVTIGTGTATNTYFPIYSCYGYNYSQQIYTAAQIGQAGTINKIRFYYDNGGTPLTTWESWRVLVGHTPKTDFVSNTDWIPVAGLTEVFNGVITPVAGNWFDLNFTTPFVYDGTSNFVVAVDENTPSYSCTAAFRSFTSGSNTGIYYYSDSNNPDPASPPSASSRNGNLAQLQVVFASTVAPGCAISFVPANAATGVVRNPVLTWMEGPGGAQSYDVYFGTTPTPPLIGNQPGTSYTPVAPLNTNSTYYWKVVPINSIGIATGCTVNSFTTGTGFNYCLPVTTYGCSNGATIGSVSTSSAITNISNLNSGCTSLTGPSYSDYSPTMQMSAARGTSFNISVGITNYSAGVKVWIDYNQNGTFEATELATQSASTVASASTYTGVVGIPLTAMLGTTRMRVRAVESYTTFGPCDSQYYGETEDYMINIDVAPSCLPPSAITSSNITATTATLAWTENGTATDWEIQYGIGAFTPTTAPSLAVNTNPYSFTNLQPSSTYHFYVRARCSATDSSFWSGPHILITNCAPITALPWTENFDNLTTVGNNFYPPCWVDENPGVWGTTNAMASTLTSGPLSGPNYLRIRYGSNATMWTPEFDLVAGETYEFSFNWGGDSYSDWDGGIYVNTSQAFAGATLLGAKFVEVGDPTTLAYRPEIYCFTPTTSGVYSFGIKVIETGYNWYMSFDDFKLKQVVTVPGIDGSFTACQTGAAVDLNTIITASNLDGSWNFGLNPNAVDTTGLFNAASVPPGVHDFFFITAGCAPDTTIATVTIIEPSSAGSDGSLAVCRNQPFNLLQGLNGMVDFGGIWTNPNAQVVANGNATSSNLPGQYNYQYIVTNGVCPADTANVVVNVQGCDYLGLEDVVFEAFNMYPNPSSDMVFITNTGSTEVFNYEVLDMNGRVILKANNAINGSTTTELNLTQVEIGVYLIRVFNDKAEKTFRVVKN
ncbi:MAG: GEVED domain-containing protein [Crocinitomicaceae bacterium]|nr:GEVED domain-containing protein [Crocinitomicaceae bacterium]